MNRGGWKQRVKRLQKGGHWSWGNQMMFNYKPHMSQKRAERLADERHERWEHELQAGMTPRVHTHGRPERPQPERPDRGRNSQPPNRVPREPRGFQQGDLLMLIERAAPWRFLDHRSSERGFSIISEHRSGFYSNNGPAPEGPYVYMGQDDHDPEYDHKLIVNDQLVRCTTDILQRSFRIVARSDRAKG